MKNVSNLKKIISMSAAQAAYLQGGHAAPIMTYHEFIEDSINGGRREKNEFYDFIRQSAEAYDLINDEYGQDQTLMERREKNGMAFMTFMDFLDDYVFTYKREEFIDKFFIKYNRKEWVKKYADEYKYKFYEEYADYCQNYIIEYRQKKERNDGEI